MLKANRTRAASSRLKLSASAVALLTVMGTGAAYAQDATGEVMETVVVTGFRASLEKALDMKRAALDSSDSILAEDIAKFPDMNVSESLQRIPGVSLNRDDGEGREITVRGLGAQFTRVLINGVEAQSTVGSQDVSTSNPGNGVGGTNRGRGFDFNVFASDLFSSLTVHKSNSASMEEGSLGATVELHTARPFDHPGFVLTASAQEGYQTLAGSTNPRFAALVSDTFLGGRLGVLVSGAYAINNTLEEGTSSVRWMSNLGNSSTASTSNDFASVDGTTCPTSGTQPAACVTADTAFRPRFPRYDVITLHEKRLGLTGSVQWQPDEDTLFTMDVLYADFAQVRNEYYLEANSFSTGGKGTTATYAASGTTYHVSSLGVGSINVLGYTLGGPTGLDGQLNPTQTITDLTATDVGLRNEHRLDHLDTRFMQLTLDGSHSFSDVFKVHMLLGWSESHHRNPIQTTLAADLGCAGTGAAGAYTCGAGTTADPYEFDYSQGNMPMLHVGALPSTATWFLSNVRERQEFVYNSYRSAAADFEYKAFSELSFSGGVDYRNFGFGSLETRRSTGGTGELATIPDAIRAVPLSSYTAPVSLRGVDVPSGATTTWLTADLNKAATAISLWDTSVFPLNSAAGYASNGGVREDDYSGWVQAAWDTNVYGMDFRGDVGLRYVLTESVSAGYSLINNAITPATGHEVYHDFLPALNAVLEPVDDFLVRFNASYAMSRPNLSGMLPSGSVSVSGSNAAAKVGNPATPPMRSKNLDLSFEWYYGKGSMISVAGFWKHLDNFVQSQSITGTAAQNPFGMDDSAFIAACGGTTWANITNAYCIGQGGQNMTWVYTATKSVKGAPLYGTEINWQQQLYFLPHPFDNFGVLGNYTYVQAQQTYYDTSGKILMTADLNNMSRNSYNATVYYDDTIFQARLTAAFRSHYIIDANILSNYNNYGIFVKSTLNLDASASYKMDENFMFTFDALNLTNQATNIYADKYAQRSYQYHETGRVFYVGVKYNY
ncbi:MAG: TonB-dependent receptor [Alphaproteobacteria bacterium]|nr:TonB-dependent receptor [Alphaproteobacteria bacterium]MDE2111541.1 TonB-dependent receptor [Alphaproteobacteria bacterium]